MLFSLFLLLFAPPQRSAAPKQVAIVKPILHQFEDGPPLAGSFEFFQGDSVFLSFQVLSYGVSEKDRVLLTWTLEAFDPEGVRLVPNVAGKVDDLVSHEDKDWSPKVRGSITIPPLVGSGTYRIAVALKDEAGGSSAKLEIPFKVRGSDVAPSDTLIARRFRFLKSEDGTDPVTSFKAGEALWARFEMVGYKFGPKNRFEVEYGLAVKNEKGEVVHTVPKAAEEADETFYPKKHLPGIINLNLQEDVPKGQYSIVLTIRDRLGMQTAESSHVFRVE